MANDLTTNPIRIDTTVGASHAFRLYIKSIRWVDAAAADDDVVITNTAGATIWEAVATAVNYSEEDLIERWVDGIIVTTLSAGVIWIELG